jgi:hypothetical protein
LEIGGLLLGTGCLLVGNLVRNQIGGVGVYVTGGYYREGKRISELVQLFRSFAA